MVYKFCSGLEQHIDFISFVLSVLEPEEGVSDAERHVIDMGRPRWDWLFRLFG